MSGFLTCNQTPYPFNRIHIIPETFAVCTLSKDICSSTRALPSSYLLPATNLCTKASQNQSAQSETNGWLFFVFYTEWFVSTIVSRWRGFLRLPLQHCKLSPAPPPASESPILKRTKLSWRWCTCSCRSHRYSSRDYKCITIKEAWFDSKNLIRNKLARNHRCRSLSPWLIMSK